MIAVVVLISAVLGFYGFNSKKELETQFKADISQELKSSKDSIADFKRSLQKSQAELRQQMNGLQGALINSTIQVNELDERQKLINNKSLESDKSVSAVGKRINEISELNVLKKEFYILKDISLTYDNTPPREDSIWIARKFNFKDLQTIKGEKLPQFQNPPFILVSAKNGGALNITKITNTGFEAMISSSSNWNGTLVNIFKFQLIIYN